MGDAVSVGSFLAKSSKLQFTQACETDTGGTCTFFACDASRSSDPGSVECESGKCICQEGYCAINGKCEPQAGPPPPEPQAGPPPAAAAPGKAASPLLAVAPQAGPSPAPAAPRKSAGPFFAAAGCHRPDNPVQSESVMTSRLRMTRQICFAHCKSLDFMKYFAITAGHTCYCSAVVLGAKVGEDICNTKCEGDEEQVCGGDFNAASVFTIFECNDSEEADKKEAEAKIARITAAYKKIDGESCSHSESNTVKLDVGMEMIGKAEECMQACMLDRQGEECMGFTYEQQLSKCRFNSDVAAADGTVEKNRKTSCYFKSP